VRPLLQLRRTAFAARKLWLPIPQGAFVLEVGSGDSPSPRADVLLDLTLENRERVGGQTFVDRPFVIGEVERLPFRDRTFDYVIAFHVLEHSPRPELFLNELQRVGKAGYIECPAFWAECVQPMSFHRLQVAKMHDEEGSFLLIRKKESPVPDQVLCTVFQSELAAAAGLQSLTPDNWVTRFHWKGRIRYQIVNPNVQIDWSLCPEAVRPDFTNPRSTVRKLLFRGASAIFALRRGSLRS
jgi:SAM-dependent methyltransferase